MKTAILVLSLVVALDLTPDTLQAQPRPLSETAKQHNTRMEWWRDARFGLFIHWGVYSVPAGEWQGKTNYGEWFMEETKMPVSQYEQFARQFNPVRFNAREWVRLAKDAGMKYIVITSKHHDGFGMFRSDLTDWCIRSTPFARDPLKELADACQEAGLTLCFYHSIMDWHHPDWGTRRAWHDRATGQPDMDRYVGFMKGQLKELLTRYGPIGVLWFDGEWESPWTHERGVDLYNYVRSLQPQIIVNNRVGKGRGGMGGMDQGKGVGDFGTPEQEIPPTGFGPGVDWESCMTMNNHWGYNKHDQQWKSTQTLIRNLIDCASKGGNYLLNVGPTSEGLIPDASVQRLTEIGRWMRANQESIHGTSASPFDTLSWGRCTQKPLGNSSTRLYFHVYQWPTNGSLSISGLASKPIKAFLLDGGQSLKFTTEENRITLTLPADMPDKNATVIALDIQGSPRVVPFDPYAKETPKQRDARMQWWREARFGLFIHWGVYSVPAGTYKGEQVRGIGEWIMNRGKIPVAEYKAFAKEFNPTQYNPDDWVRLAKDAGMKYIIITSKHHDGFALFNSKVTDWDMVDATPYGKDLLEPLAKACQRHGLKLGFYYSQAQDWNHPGGAAAGGHWDTAQDGSMEAYLKNIAAPQVREILTRYGPIAVLWWDTPVGMNKEYADLLLPLLKLQPGIIHNNRLGGGYRGDTETPEQQIPATGFKDRDWETCMTMNDTWGFKSYDQNWKSTATIIHNLIDIASKGGNYLLNVGPTSQGLIPEPSVQRLKEVGRWMRVNGKAIHATTASPFKRLPWGRCTKKITPDGAWLYLHVFSWPADGRLVVPGLKNRIKKAFLLAEKSDLPAQNSADGVVVTVPALAPDPISSTVVLRIQGALDIESIVPLAQDDDGSISLMAADATLHGDTVKYENGDGKDNVGFWTNPQDWIDWTFQVTKPGRFKVTAEIAAQGAGSFQLVLGNQTLKGTAPVTGDYTRFRRIDLGTLEMAQSGKVSVAVKPIAEGWQPINLKSMRLLPQL
jgi:alpha-L-fucosidase